MQMRARHQPASITDHTSAGTGRLLCRERAFPGRFAAGAGRDGWEGERGRQPGEEDVEAALELGGAVVGGQDGGEAAEQRELADWQPVQAQPEQVVGLVGVIDEFLELVEDVAVQEPEQGPVDVQGVGRAEPGAGEQGEDVLQRAERTGGRSASGVASGRVTSSGTMCGWASASAR